jgi:hypothetical protein
MNGGGLRPGGVAAAAILIGGFLVLALPQHTESVVRLVVLTLAAVVGLHLLALLVPTWSDGWSTSPFRPAARARRGGRAPEEVERIHSGLSGRRHPVENGPPMPPQVLRLLKPPIRVALERMGLDPTDEAGRVSARTLLSPLTWAVFTSDLRSAPDPFRVRRPDERQVAEVVHRVLDELEALDHARTPPPRRAPGPPRTGAK